MSNEILLSIIIVNYNLAAGVERLINSIFKFTKNIEFEIIVVDNNSAGYDISNLKTQFPSIRFICNNENLGFGRACNLGMNQICGKYIILLNPDTVLIENTAKIMVDFLKGHPEYGMIGALLRNNTSEYQLSYSRFPGIFSAVIELTGLWNFKRYSFSNSITDIKKSEIVDTDWITGALMCTTNEVYKMTRGFDEDYFLYEEDVDWCIRIKKKGFKIGCLTTTDVVHNEGSSSQKDYYRFIVLRHKSRIILYKKHFAFIKRFTLHFLAVLILGLKLLLVIFTKDNNKKMPRFKGYITAIKMYLVTLFSNNIK